jgi:hypothetical protein
MESAAVDKRKDRRVIGTIIYSPILSINVTRILTNFGRTSGRLEL